MKKWKLILVDDERLARDELKRHLLHHPDFEIAGEAGDIDEARTLIEKQSPQLVFLDIQMPGGSGFDLLESIDHTPEIIFTTAFDQYAVKAFEVNALDYLVKPIREERFTLAMDRMRKLLEEKSITGNAGKSKAIFVKEGERFFHIPIDTIHMVESVGNYARIYFDDKKVHIKRSLNQLERSWGDQLFFRINRNELVNTQFIKEISALPDGRLSLLLKQGQRLTVSGRQTAAFKNRHPF
jgi:two-component system LytT family response regulator